MKTFLLLILVFIFSSSIAQTITYNYMRTCDNIYEPNKEQTIKCTELTKIESKVEIQELLGRIKYHYYLHNKPIHKQAIIYSKSIEDGSIIYKCGDKIWINITEKETIIIQGNLIVNFVR